MQSTVWVWAVTDLLLFLLTTGKLIIIKTSFFLYHLNCYQSIILINNHHDLCQTTIFTRQNFWKSCFQLLLGNWYFWGIPNIADNDKYGAQWTEHILNSINKNCAQRTKDRDCGIVRETPWGMIGNWDYYTVCGTKPKGDTCFRFKATLMRLADHYGVFHNLRTSE